MNDQKEIPPDVMRRLRQVGMKMARQNRPKTGNGERARLRRQIERGQLRAENGLVRRDP